MPKLVVLVQTKLAYRQRSAWKKMGYSRPGFQSYSRSLEPTRIDRLSMTSNYEPISYRFGDERRFWSTVAKFFAPCVFNSPFAHRGFFLTFWHGHQNDSSIDISRAGLTNVRTCSAEQGPPHFRGPPHMRKKKFLSQNCILVKETAQNKLVESMYIRSFSLESRVGFVGALPQSPIFHRVS